LVFSFINIYYLNSTAGTLESHRWSFKWLFRWTGMWSSGPYIYAPWFKGLTTPRRS